MQLLPTLGIMLLGYIIGAIPFGFILVKARTGAVLSSYEDVHAFSIAHPESFWTLMWDFSGIKASTRGERGLVDADKMPGARAASVTDQCFW